MSEEERYWIGFSVFPGIGPVRFQLLISYFGSAKLAWNASEHELQTIHLPFPLIGAFTAFKKSFSLNEYLEQLVDAHVVAITRNNSHYPKLLAQIPDAPFVLYVKGKKQGETIAMEKAIAIVGTRKATAYGKEATQAIVSGLVDAGCPIISGMAYGIDAIAHETAIQHGGKTIAVLGCGVDVIAPLANTPIYMKLAYGGCGAVVSEMPLGMRPHKRLFPVRNRIISGLSRAVVVIEGAEESGSLITARNAAEQGRDVFAVPGPITSPMSKGTSRLLKSGAQVAESAADILAGLRFL